MSVLLKRYRDSALSFYIQKQFAILSQSAYNGDIKIKDIKYRRQRIFI